MRNDERLRRLAIACAAILLGSCGGSGRSPAPTTPTPAPPSAPVVASVSICEELAAPGSYTLVSDLPSTVHCLTVTASQVAVDCAGHSLGGIFLGTGVSDVSIQHCRSHPGFGKSTGVSNVTIADNTVPNYIEFVSAQNALIQENRISPGGIIIEGGSGNRILDNEIDGGYHGHDLTGHGSDAFGVDDGIVLMNTSGNTVQGNTIANVFDAGIEGVSAVVHTTIAENTISNAILAGVSSYWCTAWDGDIIRGNTVSGSLALLKVGASDSGLCGDNPPAVFYINDTTISNNRLLEPLTHTTGVPLGIDVFHVSGTGNVLQGNDIGNYGVRLAPLSAFTDGGGNVCGSQGNFTC